VVAGLENERDECEDAERPRERGDRAEQRGALPLGVARMEQAPGESEQQQRLAVDDREEEARRKGEKGESAAFGETVAAEVARDACHVPEGRDRGRVRDQDARDHQSIDRPTEHRPDDADHRRVEGKERVVVNGPVALVGDGDVRGAVPTHEGVQPRDRRDLAGATPIDDRQGGEGERRDGEQDRPGDDERHEHGAEHAGQPSLGRSIPWSRANEIACG